jgi:DNA-nicking Smr family endonuclease
MTAKPDPEDEAEDPATSVAEALAEAVAKAEPAPQPPPAARPRAAPPPRPPRPAQASSMTAGLDKRTAQRLRRGKMPPEAKLDLHGHTAAEARRALDGFLSEAAGRSLRCVLVVTGTAAGRTRDAGIMPDRSAGILRASLPTWLDDPLNRARVIAHCPAQPRDGGAGARYVLLRRRRR